MSGNQAIAQLEQMPNNSENTQKQQQHSNQLQLAKWVFNYADKLNELAFNPDAIVDQMRDEFRIELDEIRNNMNAKIQQLQAENAAQKEELQAQIDSMKQEADANKAKKKKKQSKALNIEVKKEANQEEEQLVMGSLVKDEILEEAQAEAKIKKKVSWAPNIEVKKEANHQKEQLVMDNDVKDETLKEQAEAKITLVDMSKNYWNTSDCQNSAVLGLAVISFAKDHDGMRAMFGYPTKTTSRGVPNSNAHTFKVFYAEFTIVLMPANNFIFIGLAPSNFSQRKILGSRPNTYSINQKGSARLAGTRMKGFVPDGFAKGDVIGCGLVMVNKCEHCPPRRLFFTKNGQIWGKPLPMSPTCKKLFPTISFHGAGSKVTANFGKAPFKYAIPPAKDLDCCCCKEN